MSTKQCAACKNVFKPRAQNPKQTYCPAKACRLVRRRLGQKKKRATDPTYKQNQYDARTAWKKRNPGYSRMYRAKNPDYCERNRAQQRVRNGRAKAEIAKMDLSAPAPPALSGIYRLVPLGDGIAKEDSWMVKITLLSATSPQETSIANEDSIGAAICHR